mgnify:FL=1
MARPLRRRTGCALEPTSAAFSKPVPELPIPSAHTPTLSSFLLTAVDNFFFFLFLSFDLILSFVHIISLASCPVLARSICVGCFGLHGS